MDIYVYVCIRILLFASGGFTHKPLHYSLLTRYSHQATHNAKRLTSDIRPRGWRLECNWFTHFTQRTTTSPQHNNVNCCWSRCMYLFNMTPQRLRRSNLYIYMPFLLAYYVYFVIFDCIQMMGAFDFLSQMLHRCDK